MSPTIYSNWTVISTVELLKVTLWLTQWLVALHKAMKWLQALNVQWRNSGKQDSYNELLQLVIIVLFSYSTRGEICDSKESVGWHVNKYINI